MSYKGLFPTRTGTAIGGGGERTMLDRTGAGGFRKAFRTELDGSVTMLTTHGGMPRFQNFGIGATSIPVTYTYMDTGNLLVEYPAPGSPTRLDPSKLSFINIGTGSDYLGEISLVDDTFGQQSANQLANRPMVEDMDSLAIGWKASTPEAMETRTVNKKIVVGNFPASLWTGKMRLFMQAQYGMTLESANFGFYPDLVGTELVLKYRNTTSDSVWQPGYWTHKSAGIFTAGNGKYFVIDITSGNPTIPGFACYSYEIKQTNSTIATVIKDRIAATTDPDALAKLEAYLFSLSHIDLSSQKLIGSYDPAPRIGGGIAYGWKFNNDGSKASIVLVGAAGAYGDIHIESTTVHLTFALNGAGFLDMAGSKTNHPDWMDGWGVWNMFVPESENMDGPLTQFSVAVQRFGLRSIASFAETAVYGYYLDDVWTPVTVSKQASQGALATVQTDSGLSYESGFSMSTPDRWYYGFLRCGGSWSYSKDTQSSKAFMSVAMGGFSFAGELGSGTRALKTQSNADHGSTQFVGIPTAYDLISGPPGHAYTPAVGTAAAEGFPTANISWGTITGHYTRMAVTTTETWGFSYSDFKAWTILVPAWDAEAVNIATRVKTTTSSVTHTMAQDAGTFQMQANFSNTGTAGSNFYSPWCHASSSGYSPGIAGLPTSVTDAVPPEFPDTIGIQCFNRSGQRTGSTSVHAGLNYENVFSVDSSFPYINAGMQATASYNKRYWGSEEATNTTGLDAAARFVGWA